MSRGHIISGISHGAVIAWVMFGGLFSNDIPETPEVADVSIISEQDFAALTAPEPSPDAQDTPPIEVTPPQVEETPPPPRPAEPPKRQDPPPQETAPAGEDAPDVTEITPPPPVDLRPETPIAPTPPAPPPSVPDAPQTSSPPKPRPATRIAPTPAAAPKPEVEVAEQTREEAVPDPAAQTEKPPEKASAPEEAAPEIVTEAEQPSAAPTRSSRPASRPRRPKPPNPTQTAANSGSGSNTASTTTPPKPQPNVPKGPPMTFGEKDNFMARIKDKWNLGSASSAVLRTIVVVRFEVSRDGKLDFNSIKMTSYSGGDQNSARVAFRLAKSAILMVNAKGFDLPADKYEQWKIINLTFNPENMRFK